MVYHYLLWRCHLTRRACFGRGHSADTVPRSTEVLDDAMPVSCGGLVSSVQPLPTFCRCTGAARKTRGASQCRVRSSCSSCRVTVSFHITSSVKPISLFSVASSRCAEGGM